MVAPYLLLIIEEGLLELRVLIGQHVGLRDEVEVRLRVLHLHLFDVLCQLILASQLEAQRKVVDLLGRREALVEVSLALSVRPEHVPVVSVCVHHPVELKDEPDQLRLALQHLVKA